MLRGLQSTPGWGPRGALGRVMIATGVAAFALAALLQGVGLERALTTLNDELAILPMGLSVILGITTHLGIPTTLPLALGAAGAVLLLAGAALESGAAGDSPPYRQPPRRRSAGAGVRGVGAGG